mgnify:CR=1 FL=1
MPGTDDDDKPVVRQARRRREVLGAGVQADDRPVRRPARPSCASTRACLKSGDSVYNPIRGKKERIGRILQMHANQREEIKEILAGDIAACVGLKDVTTGETLCDPAAIITLEKMVFPEPVISQAVEPKTKADQEKMGIALGRLAQEDPSFRVKTDEEIGPDHHLRHGRAAPGNHRRPHEARVRRRSQRRQAAGGLPRDDPQDGQRRRRQVRSPVGRQGPVRPRRASRSSRRSRARASEFVDAIKGGVVPREFIPAVEKGVEDSLPNGVLAGYPVVDVKVTLHLRLVPRGRLERERVQDGRLVRLQGRLPQGCRR